MIRIFGTHDRESGAHMRPLKRNFTIAAAAVAVVSLGTGVVAYHSHGQTSPAGDNDVTVCIGADSVLRVPAAGICPNGSTLVKLAGPDLEKPDPPDDETPGGAKKPGESYEDQLADLENQIKKIESALFEVVDQNGKVMFRVTSDSVRLYNEDGRGVAAMVASPEGGHFTSWSADRKITATIGADRDRVGFQLFEGNMPSLSLLKQDAGNYSLKFTSGKNIIAGIGESKAGTGALVVGDSQGKTKASMTVNDGKGALSIFNSSGNGVASLSESVNAGGLLVLTDASSNVMVKMGTNYNRYGVVMTFPPGFPYVPRSGLPGSYFLGCAAGPSCIP